jgi:hypothetical protein
VDQAELLEIRSRSHRSSKRAASDDMIRYRHDQMCHSGNADAPNLLPFVTGRIHMSRRVGTSIASGLRRLRASVPVVALRCVVLPENGES